MALFRLLLLFQHLFKLTAHFRQAIRGAFERTSILESGLFEMKIDLSFSQFLQRQA